MVGSLPNTSCLSVKLHIERARLVEIERVERASERVGIRPRADCPVCAPSDDLVAELILPP